MSKILEPWSRTRKLLETEMIAPCLKGRVRYSYNYFPGGAGSGLYQILVDGNVMKFFSMTTVAVCYYPRHGEVDMEEYWRCYWEAKETIPLEEREEFDNSEFEEAFLSYQNADILSSVASENPLVRMFAVLDRRVERQTLEEMKNDLANQPEWLQFYYELRLKAEKIKLRRG